MNMSGAQEPKRNAGYLSLGHFARAAQLSRKALRLYDQLGILTPDYVDPESGYRYYKTAQLEKARFIRLLREMEMPLADIRRVLSAGTPEEAVQVVIEGRSAFDARVDQVRRASLRVLAYLRKEKEPMSVDISVERFPVQQAVSLKKNIKVPAFHQYIPQALAQLSRHVTESGAAISGDPICFYYGPVNESDDGPVEICFPYEGEVLPKDDILLREIPAHRGAIGMASTEQSSYPAILEVWDAVVSWVQANKFELSDDPVCCYEIWHEDMRISVVQPFEGQD